MTSPYLRSDQAAEYLQFPSVDAFRECARRYRIRVFHRGRVLLFLRADLDAFVQARLHRHSLPTRRSVA